MEYMKKTIMITEDCNQQLKTAAKEQHCKEGDIVEAALKMFVQANGVTDKSFENLAVKILNKIEAQNYHQLNLLNSIAYGIDCTDLYDSEKQPNPILQNSRKKFASKLLDSKTRKI